MYMMHWLTPNYEIGDDISFRFHTLAEVGEPHQPRFRDMIKEKGWVVDYGVNIDYDPWVADFYRGLNP
jgi:hypothetical protein